jgi:hypothetical protein
MRGPPIRAARCDEGNVMKEQHGKADGVERQDVFFWSVKQRPQREHRRSGVVHNLERLSTREQEEKAATEIRFTSEHTR